MSVPESEMLDELRRRAAEESAAPPLEGEHISADESAAPSNFEIEDLTADTLELFLGMVAPNWVAASTSENIRITRAKIEKLSQTYYALLAKHLPGLLEKYPLEVGAVVQTAMVVMPLVKAGVQPRAQPEKKPEDKKPDAPAAADGA